MKTTTTISNDRFQEVCRFMQMGDTPKKRTIVNPVVVPVVEEAITKEGAFNYIYSIKDHLDIQDSSFVIKYQYKEADIEMVVVEGEVWLLEINPSIPAWMNGRYKDFPIYTQVKGMA